MSDLNDLSHPNNPNTEQSASLDNAEQSALLARLIEVENAVKASSANVRTQAKGDDTEREILDRVKAGERWMIGITILIFLVSAFQAYENWSNNRSTGKQVEQIIDAGHRLEDAGDSFSTSSANISRSMDSAVDRLGEQTGATKQIVGATERSSKATVESTRISNKPYLIPELGPIGSLFQCDPQHGSHNGPMQYCAMLGYKNFGQTPASNIRVSGFVRDAANKTATPKEFPPCVGPQQLAILARDEKDNCQITALPEEEDEVRRITERNTMPGQAFYVRGYIDFDDIYAEHTQETFCFYYPLRSGSVADRPRTCRPSEDWSYRDKAKDKR